MSVVANAHVKARFLAKFRIQGVSVVADDLVQPGLADQILPTLSGIEPVEFIDGVLLDNTIEDHPLAQPHQIELIAKRNITNYLRSAVKPYVLSNLQFKWVLLEHGYEVLTDAPQWPDILSTV